MPPLFPLFLKSLYLSCHVSLWLRRLQLEVCQRKKKLRQKVFLPNAKGLGGFWSTFKKYSYVEKRARVVPTRTSRTNLMAIIIRWFDSLTVERWRLWYCYPSGHDDIDGHNGSRYRTEHQQSWKKTETIILSKQRRMAFLVLSATRLGQTLGPRMWNRQCPRGINTNVGN